MKDKPFIKRFLCVLKWCALGILIGALGGLIGACFAHSLSFVTRLRQAEPWLVLLLPIGSIATVLLYRIFGMQSFGGTNEIILCLKNKKPILKNKFGGMSGDALLPIALRMVYQTYEKIKIPIIGMGGISTAENVLEMMLAGATAVGVGAANLVDPYASKKIIEDLPKVMERYGINELSTIIGGAH